MEILVVDDCSTDNSVEVATGLGVQVISTGRNSGVAAARNLGAQHANGATLVFLDSDVAMRPDAVANAVTLLADDPSLGAVTGNYDPEPLIRDSLVERYRNFHQHFWLEAAEGYLTDFIPTAILVMPATVFAEIGGFAEHLRETEGADFGRRLGERHRMLLTSTVRGLHDNDATLRLVLRKVFTRTRLHVPFFLDRSRAGDAAGSSGSMGSVAALATLLTTPAPLLLGPFGAVLPVVLFALWLTVDREMYRAARRVYGFGFAIAVAALHYLVNLGIAAGIIAGLLQWLASPAFRRLYVTEGSLTAERARA
jgi:GT2 family glycosyltransferase